MVIDVFSPSIQTYTRQFVNVNQDKWFLSQRAQSDWSVRLQREFKYISSLPNGMTFFCTFTFDDEHLVYLDSFVNSHYQTISFVDGFPQINDCIYKDFLNSDGERVKCFDNELISENVVRSLRQVFGLKFRYVAFPEYGSSKSYIDKHGRLRIATKRPHYHVLFFIEDFNLIFPYIYTDSHNKTVIFNSFQEILVYLYGACDSQCLDVAVISSDFGFSKYVSKYVSKGILEETFPLAFLLRVKVARKIIRALRDFDYTMMRDDLSHVLDESVSFLAWFEKHRPKLLCSNGIGSSCPFTDSEFEKGSIKVFNGKKYVDVMIPRYNVRKYCYSLDKHSVRKYWCVKDGCIKVFENPDAQFSYHWILKTDKINVLKNHDSLSLFRLRDSLFRLLNLSGSVTKDFKDYIFSHSSFDFPYKSLGELSVSLRSDIDKLFPNIDFPLLLHYYRRFFMSYSLEHFNYYFGLEFPQNLELLDVNSKTDIQNLCSDAKLFIQIGDFLSDAIYQVRPYHECLSRYSSCTPLYEKYKVIDVLRIIDERLRVVSDALNYYEFIRRKREYDALREYNKQLCVFAHR